MSQVQQVRVRVRMVMGGRMKQSLRVLQMVQRVLVRVQRVHV